MKSIIYLLIVAICWGLNFHFAKQMLLESSFLEAGFWRYAFGVFALLAINVNALPKATQFFKEWRGLALIGVIGLFTFNVCFFTGLLYTSAVNASLIVSLNPAMTLIASALILKTKITKSEVLGMSISLIGVLILITKFDFSKLVQLEFSKGDLLMFLAITLFALHNVWVKIYAKAFKNTHFTIFTNVICLLCFLLVLPFVLPPATVSHSTDYWISAIGIGCFGTGLAYLLFNKGVSEIGASKASIFMNFVPVSTAVSAVALGQQLYHYHLISGVIILTGIFITQSNQLFREKG